MFAALFVTEWDSISSSEIAIGDENEYKYEFSPAEFSNFGENSRSVCRCGHPIVHLKVGFEDVHHLALPFQFGMVGEFFQD